MATISKEFTNSLKEKFKQTPIKKLPQEVLATTPVSQWESFLFVGHSKELKVDMPNAIYNCVNGIYKKIIMHGVQGIGKTSIANVIVGDEYDDDYEGLPYRTLFLNNSNNYVHGFDNCFATLVCYLLGLYLGTTEEEKRYPEKAKTIGKYEEFSEFCSGHKDIESILTEALKLHLIKNKSSTELIEHILKQLKKYQIMLVLDDFEVLLEEENRLMYQEIKDIVGIHGIFSLIIMYTSSLKQLESKQDELLKDSTVIEALPLTNGELKDLLAKRIFYFAKNHSENFETHKVDYKKDLVPFDENAIDLVADSVKGNPLTFIETLKDIAALANEMGSRTVTRDIALDVLKTKIKIPEILTVREKQVLEFVKKRGEVTIDDVRIYHGKGRITAFNILKKLYSMKLLDKKREGKGMKYFIKKVEI